MKRITLLFIVCLTFAWQGFGQTLNQNASWPNGAWTVTGTYNSDPLAFEADPTTTSNFAYDDDDAGGSSNDDIAAESPVIDLTAASGAGETWLTVAADYVYNWISNDELLIFQYWDADGMVWADWGSPLNTDTAAPPTNNYCGGTPETYTSTPLDIAGFTSTQLSGFRYRIYFDDYIVDTGVAGWEWGFCFQSPTITSAVPPSCLDPSDLTATNITNVTADLGWTEVGTATVWDIEIVTGGSAATGTPTATGVMNPYNASGLTIETNYDFYVRADCGVVGTSNWVGPFNFTTFCNPIAAPYTEDFETFTTSAAAFDAENCWRGTGGNYFWESAPSTDEGSGGTGPDPSITTGNYFYIEASGGNSGDTTDLLSPLVDLTALTAPALTFNYHMYGIAIGTLDVIVNGTTIWTLSGEQQTSATQSWELAVVNLAAYAGQSISVTFRGTSVGIFEGDIAIDNISFTELPVCPIPNALTATNITDATADLGWTEIGSATLWDIEIVDITGGGTATGTPTVTGVANPYMAMGLTENNAYEFYVRADCGGGDFSGWAGPFSFTTLETCPAPSALNAANITEISANLGWTENGVSTSWDIEIVDVTGGGSATGTPTASGVTNPYAATGLVGDNIYEFYVQVDCGVDGMSAWAGPFTFATPYVAVPPNCTNGVFLDSGGQTGDYSSNGNITYTICPDNVGDAVTVDFTFFSTENNDTACYDGLTIYDGSDNMASTINPPAGGTIWCWDRNDVTPSGSGDLQGMMITSTDATGCLTFVFTSDGSLTRPGWVANVTCNPLSVDDVENPAAFTYHPNPVKNTLTLNAQNTIDHVTMYNMLGQEVLKVAPNTVDSTLDLSNVQTGTYFVKVTIQDITQTIRVIKQ